jgi:hypothetical protein
VLVRDLYYWVSLLLSLSCTLESHVEFWNLLGPRPFPYGSDLIGLGCVRAWEVGGS